MRNKIFFFLTDSDSRAGCEIFDWSLGTGSFDFQRIQLFNGRFVLYGKNPEKRSIVRTVSIDFSIFNFVINE